jgi:hypothetical protein
MRRKLNRYDAKDSYGFAPRNFNRWVAVLRATAEDPETCKQRCRNDFSACLSDAPTNSDPQKEQEGKKVCHQRYVDCMKDYH